jgi:hypothetical protein
LAAVQSIDFKAVDLNMTEEKTAFALMNTDVKVPPHRIYEAMAINCVSYRDELCVLRPVMSTEPTAPHNV